MNQQQSVMTFLFSERVYNLSLYLPLSMIRFIVKNFIHFFLLLYFAFDAWTIFCSISYISFQLSGILILLVFNVRDLLIWQHKSVHPLSMYPFMCHTQFIKLSYTQNECVALSLKTSGLWIKLNKYTSP